MGNAKAPVPETRGYRLDGLVDNAQIKIATSNLFIDTGSVPVDYMTGAIFDGIGGNEFINGGSSETILREGNSLISNANDILYSVNTKTNEKQADGIDGILNQFAISLKSYIPDVNSPPLEAIGISAPRDLGLSVYVETNFTEKNVYFDATYQNICIELNSLPDDEEVEVEFITSSSFDSGII